MPLHPPPATLHPPPATIHLPPATCHPPPSHPRKCPKGIRTANSSGLTLIELLSSFAILAILVTLLAVTFNSVTDSWHSAQSRTRIVTQARAVMDTIAQDLRQAVATTNFPFSSSNALTTYNSTNNWIQFVRILPAAGTNQYAIEGILYNIIDSNGTFRLARWTQTLAMNLHGPLPVLWDDANFTPDTSLTLADGLAALHFSPPADTNIFIQAGDVYPPFIDVYFELLGDDDRRTVATLSGSNQTRFVERQVLRFSQRVFLPAVNRWNLP
ncbi:MAG: PulJ/GspJ family protein [Kiritimatiellia bacterium]